MLNNRDFIASTVCVFPLVIEYVLGKFITWGILEDNLGVDIEIMSTN